jgi:hypothetical protein
MGGNTVLQRRTEKASSPNRPTDHIAFNSGCRHERKLRRISRNQRSYSSQFLDAVTLELPMYRCVTM